ncbi:isocitrate lyase/phosphoenolpyruvate mutase family protein [Mitsuaria sp. WAJ17]|uniref:isocitrate lyase/PEP mutase family protein n=1 Tax=Mitsuaria sp. WAJ17 TaxID=2761452 RepID=UPI0016020F81|nr:isocitrate lyase/phosphoenolpyruvate mutase family protein [Mitsuaria sp. WAJ17]MBB2487395.1 isocitrate lyase/phosphoenolpyruvate mutase family protein [Mitsuaria sp. WAJ17]
MSTRSQDLQDFHALHAPGQLLILANVWDAGSAVLARQAGARALATSSAALAWSLGHADGGLLPREELLGAVARIQRVSPLPLSVDIENGYSDDPGIVLELVQALLALGVAGINLEDGQQPAELMEAKLRTLREALPRPGLFINARIDTYLLRRQPAEALEDEARSRMARYTAAGADGLFLPGLADLDVARRLAGAAALPLNLMSWPGLPGAEALRAAGVRRLSAGASLFKSCYGALLDGMTALHRHGEFQAWAQPLDYARTNAWMDEARSA